MSVLRGFFVGVVLCTASLCSAAVIHLKVETDKAQYEPGDTVSWQISAWANSGDNEGISLVGIDLNDSAGDLLNQATLFGTDFGAGNGFVLTGLGTPSVAAPRLQDVFAGQFTKTPNIANDGDEHIFASGNYVATADGWHTLSVSLRSGNYWPIGGGNAQAFEVIDTSLGSTSFLVPEPMTLVLMGVGGLTLLGKHRSV